MNLTPVLNRYAILGFALFLLLTVIAFWPGYLSRIDAQPSYHFHLHGIAMFLWLALLVTQAGLIRLRLRSLHRSLGKLSYVLAPLVILSTVHFMHFRLQGLNPARLPDGALYFIALIFNALVAFAILYGLAIAWRRDAAIHARYMVCTLFPLFTPVTDRLIAAHFRPLVDYVPTIGGSAVLPVVGFLLADIILVALAIGDLRARNRHYPFIVALGVVLLYHVSVLTFYQWPAWAAFCGWLLQLPLS